MELDEYEARLKSCDWYHEMSDDHQAWLRGKEECSEMLIVSALSLQHLELYNRYRP
jgi:hypothetical protein